MSAGRPRVSSPWNNTHLFFVSATPALARGTRDAQDANDDAGQFGIESGRGEIFQRIFDIVTKAELHLSHRADLRTRMCFNRIVSVLNCSLCCCISADRWPSPLYLRFHLMVVVVVEDVVVVSCSRDTFQS